MKRRIVRSPQSERDLGMLSKYIAQDSDRASRRFLQDAEAALKQLAKMPGIGGNWEVQNPQLTNLRIWPIRHFENYLIFYRPIENGIEVVRIIHGARDYEGLFD